MGGGSPVIIIELLFNNILTKYSQYYQNLRSYVDNVCILQDINYWDLPFMSCNRCLGRVPHKIHKEALKYVEKRKNGRQAIKVCKFVNFIILLKCDKKKICMLNVFLLLENCILLVRYVKMGLL